MGRVPDGTAGDVDRAVAAASRPSTPGRSARRRSGASTSGASPRASAPATEEIAETISGEVGMPIKLARQIQAGLPSAIASFVAPRRHRVRGAGDRQLLLVREPIGVVGCITPWNYPLHQIIAKVGAALAAGCTVVLKPTEVAPLNAFSWPTSSTRSACRPACSTSSPAPARWSARRSPRTPASTWCPSPAPPGPGSGYPSWPPATVKRVALELGGKSANVILDDADLDKAVPAACRRCYLNSGQTCTALTRMLVPRRRTTRPSTSGRGAAETVQGRRPVRREAPPRTADLRRPARTGCGATSRRASTRAPGSSPAAPSAGGLRRATTCSPRSSPTSTPR